MPEEESRESRHYSKKCGSAIEGSGACPSAGADGPLQPKADQPLAEPRGPAMLTCIVITL